MKRGRNHVYRHIPAWTPQPVDESFPHILPFINQGHVNVRRIQAAVTSRFFLRCKLVGMGSRQKPKWKKKKKKSRRTSRRRWSRSGCTQHRWRSEAEHNRTWWPPLGRSRCSWIQALLNHWKTKEQKPGELGSCGGCWNWNSIFKFRDERRQPQRPVTVSVLVSRWFGSSLSVNELQLMHHQSKLQLPCCWSWKSFYSLHSCMYTCIMDEERLCTVGNNPRFVFPAGKNKISSLLSLSTR